MGQGERIEILNPCPLIPNLKRSLNPQGIKKSLNLNLNWYLPRIIFVAMSLIIIWISGLAFYDPRFIPGWHELVALLLISYAQIITLSAVWKMLSGIIEFRNLKPRTIYVAMILLFILLSGRAYYYCTPIILNGVFSLHISFAEIIILGAVWKAEKNVAGIRGSNKIKTSIAKTGIARGVDWQLLIGFSFLLLVIMALLVGPLGGGGIQNGVFSLMTIFAEIIILGAVWKAEKNVAGIRESNKTKTSIVKTGIARGVDWQWVLIGFSFLLLVIMALLVGPLGGGGADC